MVRMDILSSKETRKAIEARMMRKVAILLLLGLSACSRGFNGEEAALTAQDRHPITVAPDEVKLEIYVAPNQKAMGVEDANAVNMFIGEYKMRGHSMMGIALPHGSANSRAAKEVASNIQSMMFDRGLSNAYIEGSSYSAAPGDVAPIVMSFTRYAATTNECGDWSTNLAYNPGNLAHPNFGCATQNNLAAMVEDPHDLVEPRGMTASDIGRRSVVLETYRQGKVTSAERSKQESGKTSESDEQN